MSTGWANIGVSRLANTSATMVASSVTTTASATRLAKNARGRSRAP